MHQLSTVVRDATRYLTYVSLCLNLGSVEICNNCCDGNVTESCKTMKKYVVIH
jgi:hypothetical protein